MKIALGRVPLQWRVFLATSSTLLVLLGGVGLLLEHYSLAVADTSVRAEIRSSIQVYQALWKARTQTLRSISALMSAMSDVRAAFQTRDPETIRDSAQDLWGRISDESALFLVLDPEGHPVSFLGRNRTDLSSGVPLAELRARFPRQLGGYLYQKSALYYIVLTPVYIQTSGDPLLLDVLCAGFRIDTSVVQELKSLASGSDFIFLNRDQVFASTLRQESGPVAPGEVLNANGSEPLTFDHRRFITARQDLEDINGKRIAALCVLRSYDNVERSLGNLRTILGVAWAAALGIALLISLIVTRKLLDPVHLLDKAAAEFATGNYRYRVPVRGNDELARLAATFNAMCDSIQDAQSELIRQEQMQTIGRLATSLVHDLRNPLAAIYGGAEMLVDGNLPPDQTKRTAVNIYRASHRVNELLRDLLAVGRGQGSSPEMCSVREIVEGAVESVQAAESQVQIQIDVAETDEVFTDRARLQRVFVNLLSNAMEAMPNSGHIHIYSASARNALEVYVDDTGPGIPPEVQAQLFRPFVTSGKRSGLGIGLSLSRQVMHDLGGNLELVGKQGTGACFRLRFPSAT